MRTFRKLLLSAVTLVLASGLYAEILNPGSLVHLTTRSWFTLDPAGANDSVSFIIVGNVYEPLIASKSVEAPGEFIPFLASEVPSRSNGLLSEDGTTYTFPIRKGVRFHDGSPLTPEDVRYSLLRFMLLDVEGGSSGLLLEPILGVYSTRGPDGKINVLFRDAAEAVKVKDGKVVVRLKRPSGTFLKILASLPVVVSKAWAVRHGDWDGKVGSWKSVNGRPLNRSPFHRKMNGTGPFRFGRSAPDGKQIMLLRHDAYWRKPAALESVFLRVVPSRALRLWMLENGDADTSYFENRDYAEVKTLSGVRILEDLPLSSLGEVLFFTFDVTPGSGRIGSGKLDGEGVPPDFFKDRYVREGFAHSLDYEAYLRHGLGLRGKRAAGPIPEAFLPGMGEARYEHDLEKAAQAFRAAYGGALWEKGFKLTLGYSRSNANRVVLAEFLKAGLAKVNPKFQLDIEAASSRKLYAAAEERQFPLFVGGYYSDYPDAQSYAFGMLHSSGYYPQAQGYSNPEIDKLIGRAATIHDRKERRRIYREILDLAADDIPQICTYYPARFTAGRKWVRGLDHKRNVNNLGLNNFPYFYALSK
ncbi:ABC transporter substrate-binding protein [Elusimicrobiota bacterium]